ncbi:NADPH-dependent glutamate synthase [bacterium]|nr:NADPH-dependent glutamate synthase [bacterium]
MANKRSLRQKMPERPPEERKYDFNEVSKGLTPEQALIEAERCLECKKPKCVAGCPVQVDIPGFIRLIKQKKFTEAADKIKENNFFPAVCGRVCPQENQCEKHCVLAIKEQSVAVGYLERFAADYVRDNIKNDIPAEIKENGIKIAIVGAGPAGLACAGALRLKGYRVTIYEALHKTGGVLTYGIPAFRLPKEIVDNEVAYLQKIGVHIKCNWVIGKIKTIDQLLNKEGFKAVFIASGAGFPSFMEIPGENLNFVYSANEFLTRINLMKAYADYDTPIEVGKRVAVIGGGNTAMDAARAALRLGPDVVYLIYRRSKKEMPARLEEIHHAQAEGIKFIFLTSPVRYESDEHHNVNKVVCLKMKLNEPDESGRRRPVPIKGSEFEIEIDSAVVAIGTHSNPIIPESTPDLPLNKWGYIVADETGKTPKDGVFAGGDIVSGAATVIEAMGAGKTAAESIHKYLTGQK